MVLETKGLYWVDNRPFYPIGQFRILTVGLDLA